MNHFFLKLHMELNAEQTSCVCVWGGGRHPPNKPGETVLSPLWRSWYKNTQYMSGLFLPSPLSSAAQVSNACAKRNELKFFHANNWNPTFAQPICRCLLTGPTIQQQTVEKNLRSHLSRRRQPNPLITLLTFREKSKSQSQTTRKNAGLWSGKHLLVLSEDIASFLTSSPGGFNPDPVGCSQESHGFPCRGMRALLLLHNLCGEQAGRDTPAQS